MKRSAVVRTLVLPLVFACTSRPQSAPPVSGVASGAVLPDSADQIEPVPFIASSRPQCVDVAVKIEPIEPWAPPQRRRVASKSSAAGGTSGAAMGLAAPAQPSGAYEMDDMVPSVAESSAAPMASASAPAPAKMMAAKKKPAKKKGAKGKPEAKKSAKQEKAGTADKSDSAAALGRAAERDTREAQKPAAPAEQPAEVFPSEPTTKYLSADDSNSMASPVIARKLIRSRRYVHPDYVRTYEFLNYYTFAYPSPTGADIAIVPEMRRGEQPGSYNMQIAVRAKDRARSDMLPMNLVVLLDVSGSMAGKPFLLATAFVKKLVRELRPGERISLVTISRHAKRLLTGEVLSGTTAEKIDTLLDAITPTDITNLEAGLSAAYDIAEQTYEAKYANRVVVVSDGGANAGQLARETIAKHAEDSNRQGIYLAGVAVGEGFDDMLMNAVTDKGRGAYVFLDSLAEVDHVLSEQSFVSTFDLAVKDVRLKLVLPSGWKVEEFHGEQMSSVAAEVIPQYLSPNDQMLYHLVVKTNLSGTALDASPFELEAEYRPIGGPRQKLAVHSSAAEMLAARFGLLKGDAVVHYAETLKSIQYPLEEHREANLSAIDAGLTYVCAIYDQLRDRELRDIIALMKAYRRTLVEGEESLLACDRNLESPAVVLGIRPEQVKSVTIRGPAPEQAVKAIERLGRSTRLLPLEGRRFLALGSGPIGNPHTTSGQLSSQTFADPQPLYMGPDEQGGSGQPVYDLHQVVLDLEAPAEARSFSFDFNYFSAEYPEYVQASFNDTFYAILEASSTNQGQATNISFDPNKQSIEVDNNYFENEFHPIPNTGTGFDNDGSTGWLRTSWPVRGGEQFTLTLSIHDEGDAIYDSVVLLDNFRFHAHEAVGNTDPLN